jgi:hypothetical protein
MGSVIGEIYTKGTRSDVLVGYVINRSPELDNDIRAAGFDPESINEVTTPLLGASRCMYADLLILLVPVDSTKWNPRPVIADAQRAMDVSGETRYTLVLREARAGGAPQVIPGDKIPPISESDIGEVVLDTTDLPEADPLGSGGDDAGSEAPVAPLVGSTPVPSSTNKNLSSYRFDRQMRWRNMLLLSSHEIIAGTATHLISLYPSVPSPSGSLCLMRFADARHKLLGQSISTGPLGVPAVSGRARDQFNILARNPLHLVAGTAASSTLIPPKVTSQSIPTSLSGTIDRTKMIGIPSPSFWYDDECLDAKEILDYIAAAFKPLWDRGDIIFEYQQIADEEYTDGDTLNLDLRGRNVAEALDEIAGRIGCVWFWDRYESKLILRRMDHGNIGVPKSSGLQDQRDLTTWMISNSQHRSGGGINMLTNDVPVRWATAHQVRHVSCWGGKPGSEGSEIFVDWRSMESSDGVRSPGDDASESISTMRSPRPPIYYQIAAGTTGRIQWVADHVPAFFGYQDDRPEPFNGWWFGTIDETNPSVDASPWNATVPEGSQCAWWRKRWSVSLKERLDAVTERYRYSNKIADGRIQLSRLPEFGSYQPQFRSPSSGFQWDRVSFGRGDQPLVYEMWGSNTDPLLFPHLIPADRVKAFGLGSAHNAGGFVNLIHIPPRQGIVRTFLAEFFMNSVLKEDADGNPYMWLYSFKEVAPMADTFLSGKFEVANEWGNYAMAMQGRALNLCELASPGSSGVGSVPIKNFDGGQLRYTAGSGQAKILRTSPRGVAPCYEYVAPNGATMFFIYAPPGVDVYCSGSTTPLKSPEWQNSGASGVAFVDRIPLTGIVSDLPVANRILSVVSDPQPTEGKP